MTPRDELLNEMQRILKAQEALVAILVGSATEADAEHLMNTLQGRFDACTMAVAAIDRGSLSSH